MTSEASYPEMSCRPIDLLDNLQWNAYPLSWTAESAMKRKVMTSSLLFITDDSSTATDVSMTPHSGSEPIISLSYLQSGSAISSCNKIAEKKNRVLQRWRGGEGWRGSGGGGDVLQWKYVRLLSDSVSLLKSLYLWWQSFWFKTFSPFFVKNDKIG